ncbi:50S ribosomal protein L32 [Candidatus Daviesbacteria bacterium RIFCSPHIGHO2_01_FULL_38_8]|nr:MAG: 50S ribosomal protein L32 [Candidatus Daviesbacteria bacterium RIFCSPHIGHO2_01_FULL_38_8]
MPQEPKKKHSKAAKRTRRAAIALSSLKLVTCANCKKQTISHLVCKHCGHYAGKPVTRS